MTHYDEMHEGYGEEYTGISTERTVSKKPAPNDQGRISLFISHRRKSEKSPVLVGTISIPLDMIQKAIDEGETYNYQGIDYLRMRVSIFPQNMRKETPKHPDYTGYINHQIARDIDQDRQEVREQFQANKPPIQRYR